MRYSYEYLIKAIKAVEADADRRLQGFIEVTDASIMDRSYNNDIMTSATVEIKLKQYTRSTRYLKVYVKIYNDIVTVKDFEVIE